LRKENRNRQTVTDQQDLSQAIVELNDAELENIVGGFGNFGGFAGVGGFGFVGFGYVGFGYGDFGYGGYGYGGGCGCGYGY
jgi:hypothetical protein